ncbi:hypothetical protein DAI22_04g308701 [Oryza sativa Japonica Group]|jgi:hypothetical protein|nr:hypothetical protein DAI22_04g308701 [Oryza sativa Japonica Group]
MYQFDVDHVHRASSELSMVAWSFTLPHHAGQCLVAQGEAWTMSSNTVIDLSRGPANNLLHLLDFSALATCATFIFLLFFLGLSAGLVLMHARL